MFLTEEQRNELNARIRLLNDEKERKDIPEIDAQTDNKDHLLTIYKDMLELMELAASVRVFIEDAFSKNIFKGGEEE